MKSAAVPDWKEWIFSDTPFQARLKRILTYQLDHNPVYNVFYHSMVRDSGPSADPSVHTLPLLPIEAFKEVRISTWPERENELYFLSSGTSRDKRARHVVADPEIYVHSLLNGFRRVYGDSAIVLGWLPGYDESPHSSLIWMVKELVKQDTSGWSRLLSREELLSGVLETLPSDRPVVLFGAAFGLVDLAEEQPFSMPENLILIETGGMKTHRREMTKAALREVLSERFSLPPDRIHSEYGMCELLSQAYALDGETFSPPPWMAVTIRSGEDPMRECAPGEEGRIGVVDLANLYSCPFLLTGDRGVAHADGRFNVLGRWGGETLRGCNFLVDSE